MIKDLEVDIDGAKQDTKEEYEFQKPHPKTKQSSLSNLAGNIESELHQDGYAEQDGDKMEEQDYNNTNSQSNLCNSNSNSRPASSHIGLKSRPATGKLDIVNNQVECSPNSKMNESEDDYKYETAVNQMDNIIENNVQSKGVIKYQKAKIGALEDELQLIVDKMKILESENYDLKKINKNLLKDQKKDKTTSNVLSTKVEKINAQAHETSEKYDSLMKINQELKKDMEDLNKQLKLREKDLASRDSRLNKSVEEIERLKNQLKLSKEQSRFNDMSKEVEELKNVNKLLEKQRDEV